MTRVEAPPTGVNVRMYRPGFGDCFLLTFRDDHGEAVHCLIDCGVHSHWKPSGAGGRKGKDRIRAIAEHIRTATAGHIHVLVATHEHADHLSGFHSARDVFGDMTVGEVWMGWTEDPESKEAKSLDKTRSLMLRQLRSLGMSLSGSSDPYAYDNVGQVIGFFDIPADESETPFGVSTREARNQAMGMSNNRKFLKPSDKPLRLPGIKNVRVFVLGPPEDEKMLKAARPTGKEDEVYRGAHTHGKAQDPLVGQRLEFNAFDEDLQPFAGNHRIPLDWICANRDDYQLQHALYGFDDNHEHAWRNIGIEVSVAAQDLALRLDGATNNSSLVLAFELPNTGRVLLFPGDAQVGNWKSWHQRKWTEEDGLKGGEVTTAKDLLARTVLYKVAHHGSHNATLKKLGLEMMTSQELTAMIPVDQAWAESRRPHKWLMPYTPMYEDLKKRTQWRILRTDIGALRKADWSVFEEPKEEELYIDLHIPDDVSGAG